MRKWKYPRRDCNSAPPEAAGYCSPPCSAPGWPSSTAPSSTSRSPASARIFGRALQPAVGHHRVHAHPGGVPAARRRPRRPLRAAQDLHVRGHLVRRGERAVRRRSQRRVPDRRAGASGRRRRLADAGKPRDPADLVPSGRPRPRHRRLVRAHRRRQRDRAFRGRLAAERQLVAVDLRAEPAARRLGSAGQCPARAGKPRPGGGRGARLGRWRARCRRARCADVRADRGAGRALEAGRRARPRRRCRRCWPDSFCWSRGAAIPCCRWACSAHVSSPRRTRSRSRCTARSARSSSCFPCSCRRSRATRRSRPGSRCCR